MAISVTRGARAFSVSAPVVTGSEWRVIGAMASGSPVSAAAEPGAARVKVVVA